jgi:F420 biosynthesis protein FbiB-like protein
MKPPLSVIDKVINCASYSPSAHNAQPWRFFVIEDEDKRTNLISEMAKKYQKDLQRDKESAIENRLRRSKQLFSEVPLLIIACIDMSVMDKYPDAERQQAEMIMATQSLAAAIANLLLAATALGLGGCWFCAPLFCPEVVKSILVLPDHQMPQALITLGYPAENPSPPPRSDLEDIRIIL